MGEFSSSEEGGLGLHPMVLDAGRKTAWNGWWEEALKPEVLRKVAAERMQRCAEELVALWKKKCELSRGRPFDAREDVVVACMEAVWAALMGERGADGLRDEIAAVKVHRAGQDAEEWEEDYGSDDLDQPVWFRGASRSVLYRAVEYFSGSSASVVWALFPGLSRLLLWLMPQYRAYKLVKDREIGKAVTEARKRVEKSKGEDGPAATKDNDTCAVDFVLRNELIPQAKSEKSASKLNDRTLRDEFSMFLISVSLPNLSHHHPPRYATPSYSRCKIPQDRHSTNTTTGSPNNRRPPPVDSQAAHQQPTSTIPSARLPPRCLPIHSSNLKPLC
jgi:hypothetical protein